MCINSYYFILALLTFQQIKLLSSYIHLLFNILESILN
nr:MAG TPA: hypothetical protein [Bacteriophage sp.]